MLTPPQDVALRAFARDGIARPLRDNFALGTVIYVLYIFSIE